MSDQCFCDSGAQRDRENDAVMYHLAAQLLRVMTPDEKKALLTGWHVDITPALLRMLDAQPHAPKPY